MRAYRRSYPAKAALAKGGDDVGAVGGQGLVGLIVHQVKRELTSTEAGQLAEPVHVRGRAAEQAEPVHDLVRHEVG